MFISNAELGIMPITVRLENPKIQEALGSKVGNNKPQTEHCFINIQQILKARPKISDLFYTTSLNHRQKIMQEYTEIKNIYKAKLMTSTTQPKLSKM